VLKDTKHARNNIIARDFNVVLNNKEKRGGNIVIDPIRERLEDLMNKWDMIYIKLSKSKFT
jgi:hypothetical protein